MRRLSPFYVNNDQEGITKVGWMIIIHISHACISVCDGLQRRAGPYWTNSRGRGLRIVSLPPAHWSVFWLKPVGNPIWTHLGLALFWTDKLSQHLSKRLLDCTQMSIIHIGYIGSNIDCTIIHKTDCEQCVISIRITEQMQASLDRYTISSSRTVWLLWKPILGYEMIWWNTKSQFTTMNGSCLSSPTQWCHPLVPPISFTSFPQPH